MANKKLKSKIADHLCVAYGYGHETALDIVEKYIDVVEANEDTLNPEELAHQVEEQNMQRYEEDEDEDE